MKRDKNRRMTEKINKIELNSRTSFYLMSFQYFLQHNPQIPDIQREYVEERVEYFFQHLEKYMEVYKELYYLNPLHIGEYQGSFYIIDGQHRFMAYKRFYEKYCERVEGDFQITVIHRYCESEDDLRSYFMEINNHFITTEMILKKEEMKIGESIKQHIKKHYKEHISHSEKPKFPHIHLDTFVKSVLERFPNEDSTSIIEKIERTNEEIKDHLLKNDIGNYQTIKNKGGLYYVFMIHKKNDPDYKDGRRKIPGAVRRALWEKAFGTETMIGNCYVCKTSINYHNFHCGHKVAVAHGGGDHLSNMECICANCNLSMQDKDLESFKRYFQ